MIAGFSQPNHHCAKFKFENLKLIQTFNVMKSGFDRSICSVFKLTLNVNMMVVQESKHTGLFNFKVSNSYVPANFVSMPIFGNLEKLNWIHHTRN